MSEIPEIFKLLSAVMPELFLLCFASIVLVFDACLPRGANHKNYSATFGLINLGLVVVLLMICWQLSLQPFNDNGLLNGAVVYDKISFILKIFMTIFVLFSFYYSNNYLNEHKIYSAEYYVMGLFSLLGMMVLVSSASFIVLYLGLELFSLPLYAMVAMQRDSVEAGEAALKYFVLGAIASGILLFGISIIYGMTGSLILSEIHNFAGANNSAFILGLVFISVGIAFKFGAAPFHMWMPDLYQGAPTPVALFVSAAPKLAAFGMALRLLNDGFISSAASWSYLLLLLGVLSVAWGSIGALAQVNFKRLLAYSGISHMGFILLALVASAVSIDGHRELAYASGLYYVIIYSITSMAGFGFILMYGNSRYELNNVDDYKGLYHKQPWLALMLLMALFSMAGVPPFVGFFAKMSVIQSLVMADYYYTAVFVVLMSVVGAFYYLKLIWLMFFESPEISLDSKLNQGSNLIAINMRLLVSLNSLLLLALGIYGNWLFNWCLMVFK